VRERCVGEQPVEAVAGGDEQLSGDLHADARHLEQLGGRDLHQ
jgi:hypothetical protein